MSEFLLELADAQPKVRLRLQSSEVILGSGASCHISLADPSLPPRAVRLCIEGDSIVAEPLASGVLSVDERLLQKRTRLRAGSLLRVGSITWRLVEPEESDEVYTRPLSESSETSGEPILEIPPQEGRQRSFVRIESDEFVVGSSDECDLVLRTPYVSRVHARINVEPDGVWIEDLGSTNGTFVRGVRVGRAKISDGDEIRIGDVVVYFRQSVSSVGEVPFLVGVSPHMQALKERIRTLARLRAPVLITGETGTGKELVARALHALSGRTGEFVAVNCAALPDNLVEAQLFGHVRGAFTGAVGEAKGSIRAAAGGTVLLDEIGELPLSMQAKLLRAVELSEITPVGAAKPIKVEVRFLFATNRDLATEVKRGRFRADLYYRISAVVIQVPPLRERTEDIPLLAEHFLREFGVRARLTKSALERLKRHRWWGNVRELRNVLFRTVVENQAAVAKGKLDADDLMFIELPSLEQRQEAGAGLPLEERERQAILDALTYFGGNKSQAARALGISRSTLYEKMRRYGIKSPL